MAKRKRKNKRGLGAPVAQHRHRLRNNIEAFNSIADSAHDAAAKGNCQQARDYAMEASQLYGQAHADYNGLFFGDMPPPETDLKRMRQIQAKMTRLRSRIRRCKTK